MTLPDPAKIAADVVRQSVQAPPPVNLETVVSLWPNLKVCPEQLDGEGYFVDLGQRGGQILIRKSAIPARRRFTLAHELGHWVLREHNIAESTTRSPRVERWCDQFAANLLMPKDLVRSYLRAAKISKLSEAMLVAPRVFDVSHEAFRLRAAETTPLNIFIARKTGGEIAIQKSYRSPLSSWQAIERTLSSAKKLLTPESADATIVKRYCTTIAIAQKIRGNRANPEWMICIFPKRDDSSP